MGRPSKLTDAQKVETRQRRAKGATLAELARSYHVGNPPLAARYAPYEKRRGACLLSVLD